MTTDLMRKVLVAAQVTLSLLLLIGAGIFIRSLANLRQLAPGDLGLANRIRLMRSFDPASPGGAEVPDPYDGSPADYVEVFDLVEAAAKELASRLAAEL